MAGDLPVAEITFRTAAAKEAIRNLTRELPNLLVGAGMVLAVAQVKKAIDAGAKFIVSPGFNPKVVDYCIGQGIPIAPGISPPSEIEMAFERGPLRQRPIHSYRGSGAGQPQGVPLLQPRARAGRHMDRKGNDDLRREVRRDREARP